MSIKEENIKYFKGQIDWRLFNYILLILTEYHDQGYDTSCSIHIQTFKDYFEPIYQDSDRQIWFADEDDEYIKQARVAYMTGQKLCYFFKVMPGDVDWVDTEDEKKKHITSLKEKILYEIQKKYVIEDFVMNKEFSVRFRNYHKI